MRRHKNKHGGQEPQFYLCPWPPLVTSPLENTRELWDTVRNYCPDDIEVLFEGISVRPQKRRGMGIAGASLAGQIFPAIGFQSWLLIMMAKDHACSFTLITEKPRLGEPMREVILQETRGSQQGSCPLSFHPHL